MVTMTAREFNQDTGRAKTAANEAPVVITDRGKPSHVLVSYEEYERLKGGKKMTIAESLAWPFDEDVDDLPLPERRIEPDRDIDFGLD
jgi:hypothetical protein